MGEGFIVRKGGGGLDATFVEGTLDPSVLDFVGNTNAYGGGIFSVVTDNDFLYVGGANGQFGPGDFGVKKYHKGNLVFVDNTNAYGGRINTVAIDNDFIYVSGFTVSTIQKFHKGNLSFVGNSNKYASFVGSIAIDNDFIYAGSYNGTFSGHLNSQVGKFHKGNLGFVGETSGNTNGISSIAIDEDFIYTSSRRDARTVQKYHKGNLAFVGNTNEYSPGTSTEIDAVNVDNAFVYAGGFAASSSFQGVSKYHKGNLVFVDRINIALSVRSIVFDEEFLYIGGQNAFVLKYYKDNFNFVGNSSSYGVADLFDITIDNDFIYGGGGGNATANRDVKKWTNGEITLDTIIFNGDTYEKL